MKSGVTRLIHSLTYSDLAVMLVQESHSTGRIIALCGVVGVSPARFTVMSGTASGSHSVCSGVSLEEAKISYRILSEEMI